MFLSWNHGISLTTQCGINQQFNSTKFGIRTNGQFRDYMIIKSPWANQQQQGRFKEKPTRLAMRWSLVAQRSEQLRYVAQRRKGPQN
jgi:hypothetical protein